VIRLSRFHLLQMLLLPVLVAVAVSGCKSAPRNAFPASSEIAGWQKTSDTRVFAAKDLWQYIDGDSEQYLQAGVMSTATADYKFQNRLEAVIDVHTMRDASGASHMLDVGRSADARSVQIGDSGFAYAQSLAFRKGPYLVRIVAYQLSPEAPEAMAALARGVEARL
jgi:hypothetical protein